MSESKFESTVGSLFKGMENYINAKTVVGEAVKINDSIILPLADVTFGVAAGAFSGEKRDNGAGGLGGRISPSAVLVIQDGNTKLVNVKNQDVLTKILDMVPDLVDRFTKDKSEDVDINDIIDEDL